MTDRSKVIKHVDGGWSGVPIRRYKPQEGTFRDITRRTLLGDAEDEQALDAITRYFEIEPGGYSTLERHRHPHSIVVLRGSGHVVLGPDVHEIGPLDCAYVAPDTLHQFHASGGEPLGFLCIVDRERDRPVLPDATELEALAGSAAADLVRTGAES